MREDRRNAMWLAIWRERLRTLRWWPAAGLVLVLGFLAYQFDVPVPAGRARATVLNIRHTQGFYSGSRPYLAVETQDGIVLSVPARGINQYARGDEVCLLLWRGRFFNRRGAKLVGLAECH